MSVKALSAVFEESRASDAAFTVLLSLADWADHNGWCYPSYDQIARKARVSRSTAIRAIHDLVDLGELERRTRGKEPAPDDDSVHLTVRVQARNLYRIVLLKPKKVVAPSDHLPEKVVAGSDPLPKTEVVSSGATGSVIDDVQVVSLTDRHIRSRPSGDPSDRPSVLKAGASPRTTEKKDDETPDDNVGVITKIAHFALDELGPTHDDLTEAVKSVCAQHRIPYDSGVVRKAIESALWQRGHATRTG